MSKIKAEDILKKGCTLKAVDLNKDKRILSIIQSTQKKQQEIFKSKVVNPEYLNLLITI